MQVQSSTDPPKKLALGERAVMADGNEYNIFAAQGSRPAGRAGLCHRRHAADRRADRDVQGRAESECRAAVHAPTASRRNASSSSSTSAACARCIRRPRRSPAARRSRHQADEGRSRRGREDGRRDQGALLQAVQRLSETRPMDRRMANMTHFPRRDVLKGCRGARPQRLRRAGCRGACGGSRSRRR